MFSQTRRALEDFDNQHDFERMAADILNSLGYLNVEPMAPAGGPDGGRDIQFRDGDARGIAFVTLDKDISKKFKFDLSKQEDADGVIALFCNVATAQLFEQQLTNTIGGMVEVEFPRAWQICLRYVEMRYAGHTKEAIIYGGTFLNYGITWDEAERVFILLFQQQTYNGRFSTS